MDARLEIEVRGKKDEGTTDLACASVLVKSRSADP